MQDYCSTNESLDDKALLAMPINEAVLFPYVEIIGEDGKIIATGNQSNYPSNAAAIVNFQLNIANGFTAIFNIIDSIGGNFCNFVKHINNGAKGGSAKINYMFGWIGANGKVRNSRLHTAILIYIESFMEKGQFTFTLTATDPSWFNIEGTINGLINPDGGEITLKQAIQMLASKMQPKVDEVRFKQKNEKGQDEELRFKPGKNKDEINGPTGKWRCSGKTPMRILKDWLSQWRSNNDRALTANFVDDNGKMVLYIREESVNKSDNYIKLYMVNSGKNTPVISFNPKIKWKYTQIDQSGGTVGTNNQTPQSQNTPNKVGDEVIDPASTNNFTYGLSTTQSAQAENLTSHYGDDAQRVQVENDRIALNGELSFYNLGAIQSELKVQGDPSFDNITLFGSWIRLLFINPLSPVYNPETLELEWDYPPGNDGKHILNAVYSSRQWLLKGITHDIANGSFTTTLNLQLQTPGIQKP